MRAAELTAAPAVVRKLNELYKASVLSCQGLSLRLQRFLLDKQRLLDRIQSVTAEKLIFSHAVHTVGGTARSPPSRQTAHRPLSAAGSAAQPRCSPRHTLPETQLSPPVKREARQLQKGPRQAPRSEVGPSVGCYRDSGVLPPKSCLRVSACPCRFSFAWLKCTPSECSGETAGGGGGCRWVLESLAALRPCQSVWTPA